MSCAYEIDLSVFSGTAYRNSQAYKVMTNLLPLQNNVQISNVKVRVAQDSSANPLTARYFRYIVLVPVGGSSFQCVYTSQTMTHTGSTGIETFALTTPYTVPASGTYYSALQQGYNSSTYPYYIVTQSGWGQTIYLNSSAFSGFLTVGTTATYAASTINNMVILISAEECTNTINLTSAAISAQAAIAVPTLTLGADLTPAAISAAASEIDIATLSVGVPLTSSGITGSAAIGTGGFTLEGAFTPAEIAGTGELDTATLTLNITFTPAEIAGSADIDTVGTNQNILLWSKNIDASAYLPSVFNGDLSSLTLSSKSSRTPDAGIEISWEESGVPRAFSWYNGTIYKFHLDFSQITEEQCLWLEEYFRLHRYDEIDYSWPFDNHVYRCVLMSDVKAMYIRNDTTLGIYCTASLDLIGYEVA